MSKILELNTASVNVIDQAEGGLLSNGQLSKVGTLLLPVKSICSLKTLFSPWFLGSGFFLAEKLYYIYLILPSDFFFTFNTYCGQMPVGQMPYHRFDTHRECEDRENLHEAVIKV